MRTMLALALLCCSVPFAAAQVGRVQVMTRGMKLFAEREQALADAAHRGDRAALERQLDADFEQRSAAQPARPTPRADWLANLTEHPAPAASVGEMAVHDEGDRAVVSFGLDADGAATRWFVVDVWRRDGEDWRLATRYIAPRSEAAAPGDGVREAAVPKKAQ